MIIADTLTVVTDWVPGDANKPNFKFLSKIIKEEGENTQKALEGLVPRSPSDRSTAL